ncbi:MAG: oligosaccharide flippase family protein [Clostridia bacterium]|nr:oligosaccharide flippase family protein [Clostridia bacterium]
MKAYVFVKNALILTGVSFVLRAIGIVFKVYLAGEIGAEGIGLYQLIFSCYIFASTFAASGICTAVTRLVSENTRGGRRGEKRIMAFAALCTLAIAAVWTAVMFFGAEWIAVFFIKDIRAVPAIRILSLSLAFVGMAACYRGYFIAKSKVGLSSGSQIIEQIVRISVVILLIGAAAEKGLAYTCAVVMLGDTAAEILSCILLYFGYRRELSRTPEGGMQAKGLLGKMVRIALPITASKYLTSGLHTAENLLVPQGLQRTLTRKNSVALFGKLKGMALPLIFFPASFLGALSTLMIPEMARARAERNKEKQIRSVEKIFGWTLIASILIAGIFAVQPHRIAELVYHDRQVGDMIACLTPIIPFMYAESVVDGMLKGLNQQLQSFWYNVVDSSLRVAAVLVVVPRFGMQGFLWIMIVSNILTSTLHSVRLFKITETPFCLVEWVCKPVIFTALGGWLGIQAAQFFQNEMLSLIVQAAVHTAVFCLCEALFASKTTFGRQSAGKIGRKKACKLRRNML